MLEIGSVVEGKYKVLSEIGRGGMSTVYLAINEKANKPWAIKEVRKVKEQNYEMVKQSLMTEIDMLKNLSHKGLPSIVDVIEDDENILIVMDYIEGITLKALLKESGAQPQEKVVDWAMQLCEVLQYLHNRAQPIIYRDMKPSNIMLKSDGSVILIDFGTAREYKERNLEDTTCLGTQGYAAPEQFGGRGQTDARTDIYCLGATMYHLLTGHNPSDPPYEMYPITQWNRNLSTGLERIVIKCTQKNPSDRYQSAQELMYDLSHYKDLDISALKSYKKKVWMCVSTLTLSILFLVLSVITSIVANKTIGNNYDYIIEVAQKATTTQSMIDAYMQAIDIDKTRPEAYQGLLDTFMEDVTFTENEEEVLVRLIISVNKYLQQFENGNPKEYADFCYDVGVLYWFYYEHEDSRQTNAVKWFQTAYSYYSNDDKHEAKRKRCKVYIDIGTFYKRIMIAQNDGNDAGMYKEYWNNLLELNEMIDKESSESMIELRLYKEITSRITEYARYFINDGVNKEDIENELQLIEENINAIESDAGSNVKNEIGQISELIQAAREMILSSDKGGSQ